jgi:hypothetical protein
MGRYLGTSLLLFTVACGGSSPSATTPTPTVVTFTLTGTVTSATTRAGIAGATVTIQDGLNANLSATTDASGNYSLANLHQSKFTVTASAPGYGSTSQSVGLTSNQTVNFRLALLPVIVSFTADPPTVQRGQTTVLRWATTGATSCDIQPDTLVGTVPCNGQVTVTPTTSITSYTLSASNAAGPVSQRLDVAVSGYPDVEYRVDGSASRADIWVATASGATAQFARVVLPWTYDMAVVSAVQYLYVWAEENPDGGCITVAIYKLGNLYKASSNCYFGQDGVYAQVGGTY